MEAHDFFLTLLIILLTARVFAELAARIQTPSLIGELFAGVAGTQPAGVDRADRGDPADARDPGNVPRFRPVR